MASIVRRVRKFFGRVRAFITNEDLKQEVIPSYDSMNDLHFWEDIVGKRQVQFNGYHVFNGSTTDLTLRENPQSENSVETIPNSVLHKCSPNDTAGHKTVSNEEESDDEQIKIEIFRDNLDWSIVDGMGDTFSRPQVKKQNVDKKKGSLVQKSSKRQNVALMTLLEKERQEISMKFDEPFDIGIDLMDNIEKVLNEFKNNVQQAFSIDAETWRSKLDIFLQDSDEYFALHYRQFLRTMKHSLEQYEVTDALKSGDEE
ncbi:hypothetical protein JTE90_029374 [Oedothorax gibbosus]|uniref:Uncharacterized protein n=1 Tax=Oedothorax gibbosus TaxID=931172 RepID=A0AAV6VQ18_9ARAC|nr:hypothetical protein JTE90_029374 [Oedothorax gibbosus]